MKFRPFFLLALLVITSALPLVAASGACEAMPKCHQARGERLAAPMECCGTEMSCAPEPVAQPEATTNDAARTAVLIAVVADATETVAPRVAHVAEALDTSPPPPTRLRLARLATLLI